MAGVKISQNQSKDSACWRLYGIWSAEPSCEKLTYVKHCRNCDVFGNAARQSLDASSAESPPKGFGAFSIEELIEKEKVAGDNSALPFRVRGNCFAVPSESIVTITDTVAVHSIPHNKNPVLKGLVAINNEIYSLIDIALLLGVKTAPLTVTNTAKKGLFKRILVVNLGQRFVAFYVDEVYQIHRYFAKYLQAVKSQSSSQANDEVLPHGILGNFGQWESDCMLLNLQTLQSTFEKSLK